MQNFPNSVSVSAAILIIWTWKIPHKTTASCFSNSSIMQKSLNRLLCLLKKFLLFCYFVFSSSKELVFSFPLSWVSDHSWHKISHVISMENFFFCSSEKKRSPCSHAFSMYEWFILWTVFWGTLIPGVFPVYHLYELAAGSLNISLNITWQWVLD